MKVLVCGGRDYRDVHRVYHVLDLLVERRGPVASIVQGGAAGADMHAANWGWDHKIPVGTFNAKWKEYSKKAGAIRNQEMLDEGKPDLVIAFPGGANTTDMVKRARKAGVEVVEIDKS